MVVIRLARAGRKGAPVYQITVADKYAKLTGRHLEKIGIYRPSTKKAEFNLDTTRYSYWLSKGAIASARLAKLLKDFKVDLAATPVVEDKAPKKAAAPKAAPAKAAAPKAAAPAKAPAKAAPKKK